MIRLMVGRSLGDIYDALPRSEHPGEAILEVKELCTPYVSDISFTAHRGEILGFAGLVGAGRTEVMRALFGLDPVYSGSIGLEGRAIQPKSPAQALALGFAMVPEDRKMQGILPNISVRGNITVSMLKKLVSPIGFVMTDITARSWATAMRSVFPWRMSGWSAATGLKTQRAATCLRYGSAICWCGASRICACCCRPV